MKQENEKIYCTLYLVRHGETEWNVKKINQGQSESFLTEIGVQQAKETAEKLKDVKFDKIFSSDLSRAYKTAEIIRFDRKIIIQTSKLLRERAHGSFEGKHADVFKNTLKEKSKERENLTGKEYHSFRLAPDVETDEEVVSRFLIKLKEIAVSYPNKTVLVVTHAACIRQFLIHTGYAERKSLPGGSFKHGGHVKILSEGGFLFYKFFLLYNKIMNNELKYFIDEKFKKPGKVLDLGAGDFFDVACLKQLRWKCDGVDIKTGIDLEKIYESENKPFDMVYSNYVLHKLKNKKQLIQTIFYNLKNGGWFFIQTFDQSDKNSKSDLSRVYLKKMLTKQGFKNIKIRVFSFYDNDEGHKHWHKILEATGQKIV